MQVRKHKGRGGFTLVEMLVVILIIGVLVGMLLPALSAAKVASQRAVALNDISQLSTAIANAKTTMNARYVPSTATISGSTVDNATLQFFGPRTSSASFTANIGNPLDGNQCLVFFLGGCTMTGTAPNGTATFYTGFAQGVNPVASGGSRNGPFFDFPLNRINGSGQFTDPWGNPYVYMTTVNGNGDYTYTLPSTINAPSGLTPYKYPSSTNFVNPNGFQIISAGPNGVFGAGGSSWGPGGAYSAGTNGADDLSNFSAGSLKQ